MTLNEKIDQIFGEVKAEIETGKDLEPLKFPDCEPELVPFILRDLTPEEIAYVSLRTRRNRELEKMYMRVGIMNAIDDFEGIDVTLKSDEQLRFKTELLDLVFYWYIAQETEWKFCTVIQRTFEGRQVLIGLNAAESRKFQERQRNKEGVKPGSVVEVPSGSTLVN